MNEDKQTKEDLKNSDIEERVKVLNPSFKDLNKGGDEK